MARGRYPHAFRTPSPSAFLIEQPQLAAHRRPSSPIVLWRSQLSDRIGIAVVGTGDWGANLVRNYANLAGARLVAVCDSDPQRLAKTAAQYPGVRAVANVAEVARDAEVQGVVVSASAVSHYSLAKALL